ncbi:MAG: Ig-like domain-containing protein [Myxococcota bacterium]
MQDAPPTVTVEALPNPLTTAKVTVRGTTADDVGVTRGEASFDGQPPVSFSVTDNGFSVELDVPMRDSAETAVTVKVFDTGEQPAESRVSTIVDRVGPTVSIAEPDRVIGGAIVTVAGASQDGSGQVSQVEADFGSGFVTATVSQDNTWTVRLEPPPDRNAEDTPITIRARDKYGNETTTPLMVKVDTKGPTFTLTAPTGAVGGMTAAVAGTVADPSGAPTMVSVRFGGLSQDVTATAGAFTAMITLPQDLDGETRPVTFTGVDQFGNSGSANFDITIDTRGPTLALTGPMVIGVTGELTGTATDSAQPVSNVTVDIQGSAGPVPVDSLMNGVWRLATMFPTGLDGVTRSVALSGRDARGNVGTGMGSVTVDTVPPVGAFTSPAANARLSGAMATFSGSVSDTTSVQSVELDFADGQGFRSAMVTGGTWTISVPLPSNEDDVAHLVTARFTDGVGNASTATRSVTVDNVAPAVSITAPTQGAIVGGAATSITATVSANDPGGVSGVSLTLGTGAAVSATRQGTTNNWTATVPLPTGQDFVTLSLRATASDAAGNMNSAMTDVIVDNVSPVLTITAPSASQVFNISNFTASGNVTISWTVTDGDPQAAVSTVDTFPVTGTSTTYATAPTDNYRTYTVPVVAGDRAGNSVTRNAVFIVDRVAPTVTISPANGSRNVNPRQVTFTFSEEMNATPADPTTITPATSAAPGAWQGTGRTVFVRSGLEPYSVFTASTATGVSDRAGNPVVAASSRFHTSTRVPLNGAVVASGVWAYDVASDPDGVPMVLTVTQFSSTNYRIDTLDLNPVSGVFQPWQFSLSDRYSVLEYQAHAWRTVNADLTASPTRGVTVKAQEQTCLGSPPVCTTLARYYRAYVASGQPYVSEAGEGLIASPPISTGDGTAPVGFVNGQTYVRNPGVSHNLGLLPARVAPGSARWNVATAPALIPPANTSTGIWFSSHQCTAVGVFAPTWYCFPVASEVVSDAAPSAWWHRTSSTATPTLSFATAENGCTLMSYPSVASGRRIARVVDNNSRAPCGPFACLYLLNTTYLSAPTSDFVIGKGAGNTLLGVGTAGGAAQLYQTTDCGNTWTPIGAPLTGATDFKPTLLGTSPGFFYLDSSRTLRLHVP